MRQTPALLALVLLLPLCAAAQDASAPSGRRVSPSVGLHYGGPLRTSAALGLLVDVNEARNDGIVIAAEVGQQGNALSVGYLKMYGQFGSGYSLRAVALRTRDEPWKASPSTTYAGAQADLMVLFGIGGRVGYVRRVSKRVDIEHDNVITFGVFIGI